jgi:hypothetical protein
MRRTPHDSLPTVANSVFATRELKIGAKGILSVVRVEKEENSGGQLVDRLKEKRRSDLNVIKATIRFLEETRRLDHY